MEQLNAAGAFGAAFIDHFIHGRLDGVGDGGGLGGTADRMGEDRRR